MGKIMLLTSQYTGRGHMSIAEALMEQEQRFLNMLGEIQRWDITDEGELRFWPAAGRAMRLWPEG